MDSDSEVLEGGKDRAHLFVVVAGAPHGDRTCVVVRVVAGGQRDVDVVRLGSGWVAGTRAVTATITAKVTRLPLVVV